MSTTQFNRSWFPAGPAQAGRFIAVLFAGVLLMGGGSANAADAPADTAGLTARVAAVFEAKCAQCHAPDAKKVKKFDTIFDVPKMIAHPKGKLLKAGDPAKSLIFTAIEDDPMPPEDSKIPAVTKEELADIKAWIEAGAPALVRPTASSTTKPAADVVLGAAGNSPKEAQVRSTKPYSYRLLRFAGHFHPLVVHFPIALSMVAALVEILFLRKKNEALSSTIRLMCGLGAAGAVLSAILGWIWAYHLDSGKGPTIADIFAIFGQLLDKTKGPPDSLVLHAWLGTGAALWSILIAWMCERGIRRAAANHWTGKSRLLFSLVLFLGVGLTGAAAHIGGELVHGEEFLQLPMP